MKFFVNDLSMEGQFHDLTSFMESVERIMTIRQKIKQHGYSLFCHRNLIASQVMPDLVMQQAIGHMQKEKQQAWTHWLTRHGPFWEDDRFHSADDYLVIEGNVVTNSAVGEAAICVSQNLDRELVSFEPSSWLRNPINVRWVRDDELSGNIPVPNHWKIDSILKTLELYPQPIKSWKALAAQSIVRFSHLTFSEDAFKYLEGYPFVPGVVDRILVLLSTLDRLQNKQKTFSKGK